MQTTDTAVCDDPLAAFYTDALSLLEASGIPFLVGGTFAFARYTNIDRHTKDLDIFVRPSDLARTLEFFEAEGYDTELTFPHWLAKIKRGTSVIDVIFSSGNGVARVDDEWFAHSAESVVLGRQLRLCPPEELIWSKAFVLERERYDGADVAHLLREAGRDIDWSRLLTRFGSRWPVLYSHLTLFYFIYADQRDIVPAGLMDELAGRLTRQTVESENRVCFGTLLSREQYLPDLERHGYLDARVSPHGSLTPDEVRIWTEAIEKQ
jgi:Uncharacterised nucleotidyltransferase